MCGILGYSHLAKDLPAWLPMAALEALAHRGPDHQGTFCSEQISLGATRLRIADLEGGDQPLLARIAMLSLSSMVRFSIASNCALS